MSVGGAPLHAAAVPLLLLLLLLCGGATCIDEYGAFAPHAAAAFAKAGQPDLASSLLAVAATPLATNTAGKVLEVFHGLKRTLLRHNPSGTVRGLLFCVGAWLWVLAGACAGCCPAPAWVLPNLMLAICARLPYLLPL